MARTWINRILPVLFCLAPMLATVLIFMALPTDARADYLERVSRSAIDWVILGLGAILFLVQISLTYQALQIRNGRFDDRPDKWLENLAQAAEWFPLLGLIGTVAAILQTFGSFKGNLNPAPAEIIRSYAPAITATGSGLFMALINILPQWIARVGRDILASLAGEKPNPAEKEETVALSPVSDPYDRGPR